MQFTCETIGLTEEELQNRVVEGIIDRVINYEDEDNIYLMATKKIEKSIDNFMSINANEVLLKKISELVDSGFDLEYQKVDEFGRPVGEKTTISKELKRQITNYWTQLVDSKGNETDSKYSSIPRFQWIMIQMAGNDYKEMINNPMLNVAGAVKDELRNQLGKQVDQLLDSLFKIKSLQDQGKVEKPW